MHKISLGNLYYKNLLLTKVGNLKSLLPDSHFISGKGKPSIFCLEIFIFKYLSFKTYKVLSGRDSGQISLSTHREHINTLHTEWSTSIQSVQLKKPPLGSLKLKEIQKTLNGGPSLLLLSDLKYFIFNGYDFLKYE